MQDDVASMTARGVAAHRLAFEREPAPFGDPEADQRLQEDVAAGVEGGSNLTRYLRVRTRFFDRAVVRALDPSQRTGPPITQVVAVGAGYDGRSLRYAADGVRWFELDHPATQADKRARLDRLGIDSSAVTFVPADFVLDDVRGALVGAGLDPAAATLFTSEGVAGYLPIEALTSLLRASRAAAGEGSRLVFEIPLEPDDPVEVERRAALRATVAELGEPLVSAVARHELAPYLLGAGWRIVRATDPLGDDITTSTRSTAFVVAVPA